MTGPLLCHSTHVGADQLTHRCLSKRGHPGPHQCSDEDHTHWDADGFDYSCDESWPSSPRQMRMGSWTINDVRERDVIGDRAWPHDRYITVEYVGERVIVGRSTSDGEIALRKGDFSWAIIDMDLP